LILKDGSNYAGNFVEDKKCGYGKHIYEDGSSYEGEWVDDLFDG